MRRADILKALLASLDRSKKFEPVQKQYNLGAAGRVTRDAKLVELGRSLREARIHLRATRAQIAKKAGMTQAELSRLENGLLAKGVVYTTLGQLSRLKRQLSWHRRPE